MGLEVYFAHMKLFLSRFWPYLVLLAIVAVAIGLRVSPLEARDFWYDEAFSGILVRESWATMMDNVVHDVHPPLYYIALKLWTLAWGSSIVALRAFSVSCGIGMIIGVFVLLKSWFKDSPWPALAAAFMLAIDPFFVNYNQEARMYAMFALLLVISVGLLRWVWKTETVTARVFFGLSLLALCLTHYLGAVFSLGLVIADVVYQKPWQLVGSHRKMLWLLQGYAVPVLGGVCWLPFFFLQISYHASLGWVPNAPFHALATSLHIFLFGAPVGVAGVPPALTYRWDMLTVPGVTLVLVIAITMLMTWLTAKRRWNIPTALFAFMTFFPLLMTWFAQLAGQQLYVERFLTGAGVFLILFLASAWYRLDRRLLFGSVVVYALMVALVKPWSYDMPLARLYAGLSQQPQGRTLVFVDPFDFTMGRFYAGQDHLVWLYSEANPGEILSSWVVIPPSQQLTMLPTGDHVLITQHPELYPTYEVIGGVDNYTFLSPM